MEEHLKAREQKRLLVPTPTSSRPARRSVAERLQVLFPAASAALPGGSRAQATIPSPPAIRPAKVKKRVNYTEEKEPGTEDLADSDGSDEFTPRP